MRYSSALVLITGILPPFFPFSVSLKPRCDG